MTSLRQDFQFDADTLPSPKAVLPTALFAGSAIERHSLVDVTTRRIRDEIVHASLPPGTTLTEISLATRLGIGRGTIRAALFALEADELVLRAPYSNWSVAPLDADTIWELYTLRGALEGLAAGIVAERRSDQTAIALEHALEQVRLAEARSSNERVLADLSLHRAMVNATGHRSLVRRYAALSTRMEWLYRWSEIQRPNRPALPNRRAGARHPDLHRSGGFAPSNPAQ